MNDRTNTTRTVTSYGNLSGYSLPPTNAAGTHVNQLLVTSYDESKSTWVTKNTSIAYPTVWTDWSSGYTWWGTLPTSTAAQQTCQTRPWSYSLVNTYMTTAHDCYGETTVMYSNYSTATGTFVSYTSIPPPNPTTSVDPDDPHGWLWTIKVDDTLPVVSGVPSGIGDAAIEACITGFPPPPPPNGLQTCTAKPVFNVQTVQFLTATSTSHEDVEPSTASTVASPTSAPLAPTSTRREVLDSSTGTSNLLTSSTPLTSQAASSATTSSAIRSSSEADNVGGAIGSLFRSSSIAASPSKSSVSASNTVPALSDSAPSTTAVVSSPDTEASSAQPRISISSPTADEPATNIPASETPQLSPTTNLPDNSAPASVSVNAPSKETSSVSVPVDDSPANPGVSATGSSPPTSVAGSAALPPISFGSTDIVIATTALPTTDDTGSSTTVPAVVIGTGSAAQTLAQGSTVVIGTGSFANTVVYQTGNSAPRLVVDSTSTVDIRPAAPTSSGGNVIFTTAIPATDEAGSSTDVPAVIVGTGSSAQTIAPGSSAVIGSGNAATTIVYQASGRSTQILAVASGATATITPGAFPALVTTSPSPEAITFEGITTSQAGGRSNAVVVGSRTVGVGSSITLGSGASATVVVVLTSDGTTQLVVGSSTTALAFASPTAAVAATIGGFTASQVAGQTEAVVVGDQTLSAGKIVTVTGPSTTATIALQTNEAGATQLVVGSSTTDLAFATPANLASVTFNGVEASQATGQDSAIVVDGSTLSVGETATITAASTTATVALMTGSDGATHLVVGSSTTTLSLATATASASSRSPFAVGGVTVSPVSGTGPLVVGSQTLSPGSAVTLTIVNQEGSASTFTVSQTTDSADKTVVVAGSVTTTLVPKTSDGVGGAIASGIGGLGGRTTSTGTIGTGSASRSGVASASGIETVDGNAAGRLALGAGRALGVIWMGIILAVL